MIAGEKPKCVRCNSGDFYGAVLEDPKLDLGGPACFRCRTAAQISNLAEAAHYRARDVKRGRAKSEAEIDRLEAEAEALADCSPAAVEVENERHDRRLDDDHEGALPAARRIGARRWRGT